MKNSQAREDNEEQGGLESLLLNSRKVGTRHMFPELLRVKRARKWRGYVKSCACVMLAIYASILEIP